MIRKVQFNMRSAFGVLCTCLIALVIASPALPVETTTPQPLATGDTYTLQPDAFALDEQVPSPIGVNVRETGALGDGVADDTAAFESAVSKAQSRGEAVVVPPGTYKLTRTITLNKCALNGSVAGAWSADDCSLPTILPQSTAGPCIRLQNGGSVHGLQFSYSWGGQTPSARPATIELAGVGCRVTEVKIKSAWDAIMADGSSNVGRSIVEKCFIVNVHHIGVRFLGSWDCSWISKVEVWSPNSTTFASSGVGFLLGKNDVLLMSDCFVYKAQIAYQLLNTIPGCTVTGGTWGTFSNCAADFSSYGIKMEGGHGVSLSGGTYWTHFGAIWVTGTGGKLRMSGLELRANGGPALKVEGGDLVTITGSQIKRENSSFTVPAVSVTGGSATVVTGCVITSTSTGVEIAPGLSDVVVANNVVKENVQ